MQQKLRSGGSRVRRVVRCLPFFVVVGCAAAPSPQATPSPQPAPADSEAATMPAASAETSPVATLSDPLPLPPLPEAAMDPPPTASTAPPPRQPPPDPKASPAEIKACAARGGKMEPVCMLGNLECVIHFRDAGKECTDKRECTGLCLYEDSTPPPTKAVGSCQRTSDPCGCKAPIVAGKVQPGMCVD